MSGNAFLGPEAGGDDDVNFSSGKLDVHQLDLKTQSATDDFHMTGGKLVVDIVSGSLKLEGGILAPSDTNSFSKIEMRDDFELSTDASIEFELGGLDRGVDFDAIDIAGSTTLDGMLDINFAGQFTASEGNSFQLIDAASGSSGLLGGISGSPTFDFSDAMLSGNLTWDTSDFMNSGTISVVAGVPEPGSVLLLTGLAGSLLVRKRRVG